MIDLSQGVDVSALTLAKDKGLYDADGNLKFVPLIQSGDGCSYWRIQKPFEALGLDLLKDGGKTLDDHFSTAKMVTFNRMPGFSLEAFVRLKQKYGFKVVIDWDDYWVLPTDHLIYQNWNRQRMPEIAEKMVQELADYITCTTERLAEQIRKHTTKPVVVIPNAIPLGEGQWKTEDRVYGGGGRELTKTGKVVDNFGTRFGYVAGSSHLPDIKHFSPVLNHFPTLKFTLCGYNNPQERQGQKNVWDSMERIASFNYHNANYRRVKTLDFDHYAEAYNHLDVAIAPLKPSLFSSFKSSLKAYEAGAKKVALIASKVSPYIDDVPEEVATFCGSNKEWVAAITAHKDLSYVADQAAKLSQWVADNRDLNKIINQRLEFYNSIV